MISFQNIQLPPESLYTSPLFNKWNISVVNTVPEKAVKTALLLNNVICVEVENNQYELITGHSLVENLHTDSELIACKIIPADTEKRALLSILYRYHEQEITTSAIVKANFIKLCLEQLEEQEAIQLFSALSGTNLNRRSIQLQKKLLEFEPQLQLHIHQKVISEKICDQLSNISLEERQLITNLIAQLNLGGNKQKRLLDLCEEITKRDKISLTTLFDQPETAALFHGEEINTPQISQQLLQLLYEKVFPKSTKAIQEFNKNKAQYSLPGNCDLQPAKAFERDEVTMTVTFKSLKEFEEKWEKIKAYL